MKNTLSQTLAAGQVAKNLGRLSGLSRPSYLAGLILATLLLAACGGGGSSSSSGGGGGPQVYQVSGATVVGGFRNVTINWLNPAVGAGNVTAVNITYQIVSVNGESNDKTTLLLNDNRHLLSDGTTVITETLVQVEPARYTFTIEPVLGGVLINATTRAVAFPNVNVIVNPDDTDGDGVLNSVDVDADGDGLIEIYNATQLNMMRHNLAGTSLTITTGGTGNSMGCGGRRSGDASACNGYEQMADIDLNDLNAVPGEANWVPTGRCNNGGDSGGCGTGNRQYFSAKFNGNDYTINNMRILIEVPTTSIGFFGGTLAGSEIRNMHIRNGNITTGNAVVGFLGGLVGIAVETKIISSSVTMAIVSGTRIIGGLVGGDEDVMIVSSYAIVDELMASEDIIGGLIGASIAGTANIISSLAIIGDVNVNIDVVGGLVGNVAITNINSSYAVVSSFTGISRTGGLVARSSASVSINASYVVVDNSIVGNGGLVGAGTATAINSYWDTTTLTPSANLSLDINSIGMGHPTAALQSGTSTSAGTNSIFSEWDNGYCNPATGGFRDSAAAGFVRAWDLGTDTEYPALNCLFDFTPAQQRETAARALAGETLVE